MTIGIVTIVADLDQMVRAERLVVSKKTVYGAVTLGCGIVLWFRGFSID